MCGALVISSTLRMSFKKQSPEPLVQLMQPSASFQHPECSEFSATDKNEMLTPHGNTTVSIWQGVLWFGLSVLGHKPWEAHWGPTPLIKWGWLCPWRAVGFWGNTVWVLRLVEGWQSHLSGWLDWSSEVWEHTGLVPAVKAVGWKNENGLLKWLTVFVP